MVYDITSRSSFENVEGWLSELRQHSESDMVGILVLADVKAAKNLKIERAFPLLYSYCGYRAGESK